MKTFAIKLTGISAFAAALAATVAPAAQAQTTFTLGSGAGANSQNMNITVNGKTDNTASGPYTATIGGVANVPIFCVDASHDINWSQTYASNISYKITDAYGTLNAGGYYSGGLASAIVSDYGATFTSGATMAQKITAAQQRASEIAWLADSYYNATTFGSGDSSIANNQTAITASIWDIIQNGGNGAYTAGSSFVLNTPGYNNLINYYENLAVQHTSYKSNSTWVQAPIAGDGTHFQDFLAITPVPEPGIFVTAGSFASMLAFGIVRGRRRAAAKANAIG